MRSQQRDAKVETSLPGMPKKTKREKIIAEYRRKLLSVSDKTESTTSADERGPITTQSLGVPTFTVPPTVSKNDRNDSALIDPLEFAAIKKDLVKTLLVTCCIIVGQIIIWRVVG